MSDKNLRDKTASLRHELTLVMLKVENSKGGITIVESDKFKKKPLRLRVGILEYNGRLGKAIYQFEHPRNKTEKANAAKKAYVKIVNIAETMCDLTKLKRKDSCWAKDTRKIVVFVDKYINNDMHEYVKDEDITDKGKPFLKGGGMKLLTSIKKLGENLQNMTVPEIKEYWVKKAHPRKFLSNAGIFKDLNKILDFMDNNGIDDNIIWRS